MVNNTSELPGDQQLATNVKSELSSMWSGGTGPECPLPESVTVTLTQNPGEGRKRDGY